MKRIMLTGATGHMGVPTFEQILETGKFDITLFMRCSKKNIKFVKKYKKTAIKKGINLRIVFGDIYDYDACKMAVQDADYIIHMAAIIPPKSDYDSIETFKTNYEGTKCLVDAVVEMGLADTVKFVHIATVAEYGNRDYKHPWGRIGDPLVCSYYDVYGISKIRGEKYVLESGIKNWVSLRQTGVLYDEMMMANSSDGLMFHTCFNVPIEWTTARSSGLLLKNLVTQDSEGVLEEAFWRKCYNIGNGAASRVTGYDTVNAGFQLMGATAKELFNPNDCATRNFHCMWYLDSHILEDYFHFQNESFYDYWKDMSKKFWYFKFGKPYKKLIKKMMIEKLYKSPNAPKYWVNNNLEGRINAFYGGIDKYNAIPNDWKDFGLLCEGKLPDGTPIDYEDLKDITKTKEKGLWLNHGYDESKPDSELDIADMQQAAEYRGGKCLSENMVKGDLYTKLKWQDYYGNEFMATPYTVLKAGHWSDAETPAPWRFDEIAKHSPFVAQIWYDTHDVNENNVCTFDDAQDIE